MLASTDVRTTLMWGLWSEKKTLQLFIKLGMQLYLDKLFILNITDIFGIRC